MLRIQSRYFSATTHAFNLLHLYLALPLGMIPFEFYRNFRREKTRVPGLLCGIVCMIVRLAVSVEHHLVSDEQTNRQTNNVS